MDKELVQKIVTLGSRDHHNMRRVLTEICDVCPDIIQKWPNNKVWVFERNLSLAASKLIGHKVNLKEIRQNPTYWQSEKGRRLDQALDDFITRKSKQNEG